MGKKYSTQYRIHVYDMSNPLCPDKKVYLPSLHLKGRRGPLEYPPNMKTFPSFHRAMDFALKKWWRELGAPDPEMEAYINDR